jgi:site-specific recombinase XerD
MKSTSPTLLAHALQDFFGNYLPQLRGMSPHTISSYRDSLVLLLRFIAARKKIPMQRFDIHDIDTTQILAFLSYLEVDRHNTASSRNVRLAAIHAFFQYLAGRHPEHLDHCQRIVSIPFKRARTRTIDYLEYEENEAPRSKLRGIF